MFALKSTNRRRRTKTSRKTLSRSLDFELMEPRIVLSHKTGHEPPGGGGNGGGGDPPAAEYSLVDLGALPGHSAGTAQDVNESGWVVGASWLSDVSGTSRAMIVIPDDIDGDGDLDWYADVDTDGKNDLMIELTTVPSVSISSAIAINNAGQVAGTFNVPGEMHAFVINPQDMDGDGALDWNWDADADGVNDLMTDLGTLGGNRSSASDINDQGQVVGQSRNADGNTFPFLWNPDTPGGTQGTMVNLGTIGLVAASQDNQATGINESGQVVGRFLFETPENGLHHRAFVITPQDVDGDGDLDWYADADADGKNDLMVDLGTLDTKFPTGEARAINDSGLVVGEGGSDLSDLWGHAVQWQEDAGAWNVTDLGGLHKRLFHSDAQDVNNQGQVVGHSQEMVQTIWGSGGRKGYEAIGDSRVFLVDGEMKALDTLVADMAGFTTLEQGNAIADAGFIVGEGDLASGDRHAFIAVPIASAGSATSSLLAAASESTKASSVSLVSRHASDNDVAIVSTTMPTTATTSGDDAMIVSVATPLPATATVSTSSTKSKPISAIADDTDTVDKALSGFETDALDDTLLEDLAAALVG